MILDDVLYLIDIDDTPLRALPEKTDWELEDLDNSTNQLKAWIPLDAAGIIRPDQQIIFKGRRFFILDLETSREERDILITCDEAQARLTDVINPTFILIRSALRESITKALGRSGWKAGDVFDDGGLTYNADIKARSSMFELKFLENQSGGRLYYDSARRLVHMLDASEQFADVAFRYGRNVANITKHETSPQATVLYAYGRDGMTIEALTGGEKFVEDFSWYTGLGLSIEEARAKYTKETTWEDDRYIYNSNLYRDALTKLSGLAQPAINYSLNNPAPEDVRLGVFAYVQDEELGIRVRVIVSRLKRCKDPENDEIELNYIPPSLGSISDDQFTGDTNSDKAASSFFVVKNQSAATLATAPAAVITADITVYSATAFEVGLTLTTQITTGGVLVGYFTLEGERLPTEIKQTVAAGWYTLGLPFVITGVQEGTKALRFFLHFEAGGAGSVPKEKAQFFVKASGVYGGDSNEKPDQTILEEITLPAYHLSVADSAIEFRDLPRRFELVEAIAIPETFIEISEGRNIFLDPPPVGAPPPEPLSDTQIRAEFADMRNYEQATKPTQNQADEFIDELHADANHFIILASEFTVYIIASYGSFIAVDYPTTGDPVVTSDGSLYLTYGANNVFRGQKIDWSINNPDDFITTETYSVPDPVAPGEAGPPRRIQYEPDYSVTETAIEYTPAAGDRLALTPVTVGTKYRITRGAATEIYAVAFTTSDPLFNQTTEPLVIEHAAQDPAALELDITAPTGSSHLLIYEQGPELPEIVVQAIEPGGLLWDGIYREGYFTAGGGTLGVTANAIGVLIKVEPGSSYTFTKDGGNRFRSLFTERKPLFEGTAETFAFNYSDHGDTNKTLTFTAPTGALYWFAYIDINGTKPGITITKN